MSQVHQILSKENGRIPLNEQIEQEQAGQFVLSTIAQELRNVSERLQDSTLLTTTFETIKKLLRSARSTELSETVRGIFSGKE